MYCTKCGGVLDNIKNSCPSCGNDHGGPGPASHARSLTRGSLPSAPRWVVGLLLAAITALLLAVGVARHRSAARTSTDAYPARTEAGAPTITAETKGPTPAAAVAAPELKIGNLLLKARRNTDAILGRPKPEDIADCDPGDRGYAYPDDSYVCTHNGNVILLSYRVKSAVSGPDDLLRAVGLQASVGAIPLFATTSGWLHKRGNPLSLGDKLIPKVIVFLGQGPPTIVVDMSGWQAIQTKTVPKPSGLAPSGKGSENRSDATISLGEIVRVMNKAATAIYGKTFILRYEGGPFGTVEVNPGLWETLTPLQQEAFGTRLAEAFGRTGQINCRVKVYGIEVGRVSPSLLGGYQYKPR